MIYQEKDTEQQAALTTAEQICAAARTSPKACGIDHIHTLILTGKEKDELAFELTRLGEEMSLDFYKRDANNLLKAQAVALIGTTEAKRGLGDGCGYCHFGNCRGCGTADGTCVFDAIDLGIALGSAVSLAADLRTDTRIMYSIGKAALSLNLFDPDVKIIMGIPISVSGKSPFFDRK